MLPKHWPHINMGTVVIGMTECELLAARGAPSTVNRSVSSYGERKQYVYRSYAGQTVYVYTRDGLVTSWQD